MDSAPRGPEGQGDSDVGVAGSRWQHAAPLLFKAFTDALLALLFPVVLYLISLGADVIGVPVIGVVILVFAVLMAFYIGALFVRRLFVVFSYLVSGGDPGELAIRFLTATPGDMSFKIDPTTIPSQFEIQELARLARNLGPRDIFTRFAAGVVFCWWIVLMILMPIRVVTTMLGGCLWALTFGLLGLVLQWMWVPFELGLLSTSWAWLHWWPTRPLLLLPGLVIALLAGVFLMIVPEPNERYRYYKLAQADQWPYSWYITKPADIPGLAAGT